MAGSAPIATASFNKASYTPGDLMVLTVDHTDVDRATLTVAGVVKDTQGNEGPWSATCVIDDGTLEVRQAAGKTWTIQSATRDRTVLTAVA